MENTWCEGNRDREIGITEKAMINKETLMKSMTMGLRTSPSSCRTSLSTPWAAG